MNGYNVVKIALIGDAGSGKTSLGRSLTKQPFSSDYIATIGADLAYKYIEGDNLKVVIWDLAGQDRFSFLIQSYVTTCNMVCLCYSADQFGSYQKLKEKFYSLKSEIGSKPICVVALKNDLVKSNFKDVEWGSELACQLDCPFYSTSSLKNRTQDVLDWILRYANEKFFHYMELEAPVEEDRCPNFCKIQ